MTQPLVLECEILVIGSGAGAAAAVRTLVPEQGGVKVPDILVAEEGPHIPAAKAPATMRQSLQTLWRQNGLTMAFGRQPVAYAEGRCVGGGTEINSAILQRTPPELLERWGTQFEIEDFSASHLAPFYERVETLLHASETPGPLGKPSDLMARMGHTMGWKTLALKRAQNTCVGTNHCANACPTGAKQSMSTALWPALLARGVRLVPGLKIGRIHHTGGTATHASGMQAVEGRCVPVTIRFKHLFVCAGATQTPALLQRSRLMPSGARGFLLHPTIRAMALFEQPVEAPTHRLPLYAITEFMPDVRLGGSIATLPSLGMFRAEDPARRNAWAPAWNHSAMYYAMARGTGSGRIDALPFGAPPLVRYSLSSSDWQALQLGLEKLTEGLFAVGAKAVQPSITGMPAWRSMAEMRAALHPGLHRLPCSLMSIHLFSSTRMGRAQPGVYASSYGSLHGLRNVRVADASLIPESPGVNPQATVMALAMRTAEHFKATTSNPGV